MKLFTEKASYDGSRPGGLFIKYQKMSKPLFSGLPICYYIHTQVEKGGVASSGGAK